MFDKQRLKPGWCLLLVSLLPSVAAAQAKQRDSFVGDQGAWVHAVAFSPDAKTLASGGFDGIVKLWDLASGKNTITIETSRTSLTSLAYKPDGTVIATGGMDGSIKLW